MSELIDRQLENHSYSRVEKDSYKASSSDVLVADSLGTCIAIGVYDGRTEKSYLLHTRTLENETVDEEVENFVNQIKEDLTPPYEVLAGGTIDSCYNPLTEEREVEKAREAAEEALNRLETSVCAAWNRKPVFNRITVSPERGILYDRVDD